jgi:hypothetical protein
MIPAVTISKLQVVAIGSIDTGGFGYRNMILMTRENSDVVNEFVCQSYMEEEVFDDRDNGSSVCSVVNLLAS